MAKKTNPHRSRPLRSNVYSEEVERARMHALAMPRKNASELLTNVYARHPDSNDVSDSLRGKNVYCDYTRDLVTALIDPLGNASETDADSLFVSLILNDDATLEFATRVRDAALFLREA